MWSARDESKQFQMAAAGTCSPVADDGSSKCTVLYCTADLSAKILRTFQSRRMRLNVEPHRRHDSHEHVIINTPTQSPEHDSPNQRAISGVMR